jgi:hypothetical protein
VARRWFGRSSTQLVHAAAADSTGAARSTRDLGPDDSTGPAVHRLMAHLDSASAQSIWASAAEVDTAPEGARRDR